VEEEDGDRVASYPIDAWRDNCTLTATALALPGSNQHSDYIATVRIWWGVKDMESGRADPIIGVERRNKTKKNNEVPWGMAMHQQTIVWCLFKSRFDISFMSVFCLASFWTTVEC